MAWYSAGPANGRARTDGPTAVAREGSPRTPADIRENVRRLIEARNPEAALLNAALYLQEADRIYAEAAHEFSEARRVADHAVMDHAEAAADRQSLAHEWRELERERHELEARTRQLDHAFENLKAREAAVAAAQCELQKKSRKRVVEAAPEPEFLDSPSLQLRPDPSRARTAAEFLALLADFHTWRGNRSLRQIAEASGDRISASTVGNILRGSIRPDRLDVIDAFVIGCGGSGEDRAAYRTAWRRLYMTPDNSTLTDIPSFRPEME